MISGGIICLVVFFFSLLSGLYSRHESLGFVMLHAGVFLSFGFALIIVPIYFGLIPQQIIVNKDKITYKHGLRRKQISWKEVKKVVFIGTIDSDAEYCCGAIETPSKRIVYDTDFSQQDIMKLKELSLKKAETYSFEVEEKED
jgi:hypothetical protein